METDQTREQPFGARLLANVRRCATPALVGLDPRLSHLPMLMKSKVQVHDRQAVACAYRDFCCAIVDVVAPSVAAVKLQAAFFEALGVEGMEALFAVIRYARQQGLLVILDAKRGDIGDTAEAYAQAYLAPGAPWPADALTVNPFLGPGTCQPFLQMARQYGRGLFVLVKTSNPDSAFVQDAKDSNGTPVYERLAEWVECQTESTRRGEPYGNVGAVVGATYPEQLQRLRQLMPHAWILVPGYGAQGATARDTAGAFHADGTGALINASRSVIFAYEREPYCSRYGPSDWQHAVEDALRDMIEELAVSTPAGSLRRLL